MMVSYIYLEKLWEFNQLRPSEQDKKQKYMKEVFAECGEDCFIELPFRANWGGKNLHFGNRVYANFNLTVVDDGEIFVGDKVMFGPNVTIATANHPIDPSLREDAMQYNKSVHIGEKMSGLEPVRTVSGTLPTNTDGLQKHVYPLDMLLYRLANISSQPQL